MYHSVIQDGKFVYPPDHPLVQYIESLDYAEELHLDHGPSDDDYKDRVSRTPEVAENKKPTKKKPTRNGLAAKDLDQENDDGPHTPGGLY